MSATERAMGLGLRVLNRFAGLPLVDRLGLRKLSERGIYHGARAGFLAAGAVGRRFSATQKLLKAERPGQASPRQLFDLTPSDEQAMLREAALHFAHEALRPAASDANRALAAPAELLKASADLGLAVLAIPEALGGAGGERSAVTQTLVTEALAQGDLSLAVACLAPSAVSTALVLWGNAEQQAQYLPAFVADDAPAAALAVQEPQVLFDPFALKTTARRKGDGYVLDGIKTLVPRARECALLVVAAECEGQPGLFIVETRTAGINVEDEPAMGLRGAATGRIHFSQVQLPASARLGTGDDYAACIGLSRIAWCALATGTAQAMLDALVPYANERIAFGEPISHRQAVAFMIADIAVELEGLRLATWRAASRAEQGLDCTREVALARQLALDKAMKIGNDGVQVLGGHGFTQEYPVERWYRDLRACGFMEGVVLV